MRYRVRILAMSKKDKKLYYEVLPADDADESTSPITEVTAVSKVDDGALNAQRDEYAELIAAVKNTPRVRFRVRQNYNAAISVITIFLAAVIIAGSVFLSLAKSRGMLIAVTVVMLAAIVGGISAMIYQTVKAKREYYCYYENTENGVYCMSVIEDLAVVYANGRAYRIKGEEMYTLDEQGFSEFLDGECSGLFSILSARREDVEYQEDTGLYFVKNRVGGGHTVLVEDGRIIEITSEQPFYTDDVDASTGERKVKTKIYIKTDPEENFAWEVPAFVREKLRDNGVDVNKVTPQSN